MNFDFAILPKGVDPIFETFSTNISVLPPLYAGGSQNQIQRAPAPHPLNNANSFTPNTSPDVPPSQLPKQPEPLPSPSPTPLPQPVDGQSPAIQPPSTSTPPSSVPPFVVPTYPLPAPSQTPPLPPPQSSKPPSSSSIFSNLSVGSSKDKEKERSSISPRLNINININNKIVYSNNSSNNENNNTNTASEDDLKIIKEGWIWKRARNYRWQKKFARLQASSLQYFEKIPISNNVVADGVILLPGYTIKKKQTNDNTMIVLKFPSNIGRNYYLQAETERELELWFVEIQQILDKYPSVAPADIKTKKMKGFKNLKSNSNLSTGNQNNNNNSTPVFAVPLQSITHLHPELLIPHIVVDTIHYLENNNNIEVEGIFRKSGSALQIQDIRDKYNHQVTVDYNAVNDPHCVAGLLKLFLRELPDPLLTYALYDKWTYFESVEEENRVNYMQSLISQLPEINRRILIYLFRFLTKVSEKADVNLMSPSNLAIVFSPNIIKKENASMVESMLESRPANEVVKFLVENTSVLFDPFGL